MRDATPSKRKKYEPQYFILKIKPKNNINGLT